MPEWAWLLVLWLVASVCFALGIAKWFRWLREPEEFETLGVRSGDAEGGDA